MELETCGRRHTRPIDVRPLRLIGLQGFQKSCRDFDARKYQFAIGASQYTLKRRRASKASTAHQLSSANAMSVRAGATTGVMYCLRPLALNCHAFVGISHGPRMGAIVVWNGWNCFRGGSGWLERLPRRVWSARWVVGDSYREGVLSEPDSAIVAIDLRRIAGAAPKCLL